MIYGEQTDKYPIGERVYPYKESTTMTRDDLRAVIEHAHKRVEDNPSLDEDTLCTDAVVEFVGVWMSNWYEHPSRSDFRGMVDDWRSEMQR